jgi:hypothetical protein
MNLLEALLNPELYTEVLSNLRNKKNKKKYILTSAPVEKYITLGWCLNNPELIFKYFYTNIKNKKYKPQPRVKLKLWLDKERTIYNTHWVDKIFDYALSKLFFDLAENVFSEKLFSYRKNFSNRKAVSQIADYLKQNNQQEVYVLKRDIKSYYDNIDGEILIHKIELLFGKQDPYFIFLVKSLLSPDYYNPELDIIEKLELGIPTGVCFSNFAANLYLTELDHIAASKLDFYIRYGDDLIFADRDYEKITQIIKEFEEELKTLKLEFKTEKNIDLKLGSNILYEKELDYKLKRSFDYLGYQINERGLIFLKNYKYRNLKKNIKSRLINSYKSYKKHLNKQQIYNSLIRDINNSLKNINYYNHYSDLILFVTDTEKIKEFDKWLAKTVISIVEQRSPSSAFNKISYKEIREAGLISVLNYKNVFPRKNEVYPA